MRDFKKLLILASLSAVVFHSVSHPVFSARISDTPDTSDIHDAVDAPARANQAAAPTLVTGVNRSPAVEPRVYIESADIPSGFSHYDYSDRVNALERAHQQHAPTQ